jgi:hypothetical protein
MNISQLLRISDGFIFLPNTILIIFFVRIFLLKSQLKLFVKLNEIISLDLFLQSFPNYWFLVIFPFIKLFQLFMQRWRPILPRSKSELLRSTTSLVYELGRKIAKLLCLAMNFLNCLLVDLFSLRLMERDRILQKGIANICYIHFLFIFSLLILGGLSSLTNILGYFVRPVFHLKEVFLGHLLYDVGPTKIIYEASYFLHESGLKL